MSLDLSPLDRATIVFDLDGTLVDTAPNLIAILNGLLAQRGVAPLAFESARPLIGRGARALISRGFDAAGAPLTEPALAALFEQFIDHHRAHIADASQPYPGVAVALERLRGAGAQLAVCTNKRTDLSLALLEALNLADYFAAIVGPDAAPAAKPDPRHLTTAIERAGGRRDRSVMVGDTVFDAEAARAAGVPLVLVSFGYSEIPTRDLAPDVLINHFDELAGACSGLLRSCPTPAQSL